MRLEDRIMALKAPKDCALLYDSGYCMARYEASLIAHRYDIEREQLVEALQALEDWVGGTALDLIPNDVYHSSGGFDKMQKARAVIERAKS